MDEIRPAIQDVAPPEDDILTAADVAKILKCEPCSIYNLTRSRGRRRYANPIPVIRVPFGLRFKKSSVLKWLDSLETTGELR